MSKNPDQPSKKAHNMRKLWVPVVLLSGTVVGLLFSVSLDNLFPNSNAPPPFSKEIFVLYFYLQLHVVLSTISIALLIALLVVYGRTYVQTKANFIFGLLVVLLALLLQNLVASPVLHLFVSNIQLMPNQFSSPVADLFTIIAYSVFLYLSLE
ncbi:MAG: hypothetical protein ACREBS_02155 [Nitrososphaerales archaeon]